MRPRSLISRLDGSYSDYSIYGCLGTYDAYTVGLGKHKTTHKYPPYQSYLGTNLSSLLGDGGWGGAVKTARL